MQFNPASQIYLIKVLLKILLSHIFDSVGYRLQGSLVLRAVDSSVFSKAHHVNIKGFLLSIDLGWSKARVFA